jgi:hypothetical protein
MRSSSQSMDGGSSPRMPREPLRADSGRFSRRTAQGHEEGGQTDFSGISAIAEPITIYMTNYWHADHLDMPAFSVSDKQPDGFEYERLACFIPVRGTQKIWESSKTFKEQYDLLLKANAREIVQWLEELDSDVALCCWCKDKPYKLTRCTLVLVAQLIKRLRPDLNVKLNIKSPAWRV